MIRVRSGSAPLDAGAGLNQAGRLPLAAGSVARHEDRKAETGEMVQRLIDAYQRPEPRMLVLHRHAEAGSHDPLDAVDGDVNREVDKGDEPESRRDDQDQRHRYREVDEAMRQ